MNTKRCRSLLCEQLEDRRVLAAFGTPWPEPRSLTISFPSDQAKIGAYSNLARFTLDQVADRQQWQESALRAFQTWAVETNLNLGLTTDRGDHFGAIGLSQGDPRFGDIRIGAFPQQGVLANALPYQTIAGTWSGDVLLNTRVNYFLGDWQSDSPIDVPDPNDQGPAVELFSVLLHEAGNALGLPDVESAGSVMHASYEGPKGELTTLDVQAIQSLYGGPRQDIYESTSNDGLQQATRINNPAGFDGSQPLSFRGSLNTRGDLDHYRIEPLRNQEKMVVRLRATEISLLKSHLFVLDQDGNVIADAKADSIFENDLELEIGSLQDHRTLFLRVESNSDDVFGIGDYEIDIDYRPPEARPELLPLAYDADAEDDDDDDEVAVFDRNELVDVIFSRVGLVDREKGANDTLADATRLESIQGFLEGTRYEAQGALTSGDVDYLSFATPATIDGSVSIKIETVGLQTPILHADVLDASGHRVPARATPRADGSVSFEMLDPAASNEYFLRVRTAEGSAVSIGNYVVTIDVATRANVGGELLDATAVPGNADWTPVWVTKTQLFRFDLSAAGQQPQGAISVAVYDPRYATVITSFAAAAERLTTEFVWLQRGKYYVRVEAIHPAGALSSPLQYQLSATGISDDQGPLPDNPFDPYGGGYGDPYGGGDPDPDPYGGGTPVIYPLPDPYGGASPFGDPGMTEPDLYGEWPYGDWYEYLPDPDPLYTDPYYDNWYNDPYHELYDGRAQR